MNGYPVSAVEEIQLAFTSSIRKECSCVPDSSSTMKCPRHTTNLIKTCLTGPYREAEWKLAEQYREKI